MTRSPRTFSLRDLFLSMACFALAIFLFTLDFNFVRERRNDSAGLFVFASLPVIGAAVGGGVGVLVGRFGKATFNGFLIGFLCSTLVLFSLLLPTVRT